LEGEVDAEELPVVGKACLFESEVSVAGASAFASVEVVVVSGTVVGATVASSLVDATV